MTKRFPWFRLYAGDLRNDRKIKRIAKKTGIDKATITGMWVTILCLASDSPERGKLLIDGGLPMEYEEIAEEVGLDVLKFDAILRQFLSADFDMLAIDAETDAYLITKWGDRQPPSDATGSERTKKWRAKKRKSVTSQKRHRDGIEEEEDTDKEEEVDLSPPSTPFSRLSIYFVNITKIPEFTGGAERWSNAIKNWMAAGVEEPDIDSAYKILREKGYTVTGPWSLTNTAISEMSRRIAGLSETDKIKVSLYGNK